ncbi:MAG: CvpA family protein [Sphingobacteriales bacterium]|nr:MAG: CvpA family protein [Sphingobacteriales bacterium]
MGLDIVLLALLTWYGFKGYKKGIVQVLFSTIAMIAATLGALKLSGKLSGYFFQKDSDISPWLPVLSFILVFAAILFLVFLISKTVDTSLKKIKLGWLNRLAGMALYILIISFVFSTILWLGDKVNLIKPETKAASVTYAFIAPIAPKGFELAGTLLPFVKSSYAELEALFDKIDGHLP